MKITSLTLFVLTFIAIFLMPTGLNAQKVLTEVDLRINGVGEDSGHREVIDKIGKPLRVRTENIRADQACSDQNERHRTLVYDGLEIVLLRIGKGEEGVTSMKVTSGDWDASGVGIGDSMDAVVARFGEPSSREVRDDRTVLFYVTPGNLGSVKFEFVDGKIAGISMSQTLC
ncbi:MAG: hypothetical protein QUS14_04195 [Pyrinomonadaceae bacterium]|nr:hypothetical protein [Pyrinomonadaceae bacterium]